MTEMETNADTITNPIGLKNTDTQDSTHTANFKIPHV